MTGVALVGIFSVSCGSSDGDRGGVRVERDIDVAGITVTDVFAANAPAEDPAGYPVVVMLHGGDGDPTEMEPLAEAVAERGAVVYVPTWPVVSERLASTALDDAYRAQVEAVVCSLRQARRTAADFGGNADDLTLLGHSAGGFVGAAIAIVDEPPWPGIDCDADVDHRPKRFIGTSGDYTGWTLYARDEPAVSASYDPQLLSVTNDDLEVRLIHGFGDDTIWADTSLAFRDHLADSGLDARVLALDVGHSGPIQPTVAPDFIAELISGLLRDESTAFEPARAASLSFVDDRCVYDGPEQLALGDAVAFDMRNGSDARVYFVFVAFVDWRPADIGLDLDGQPWVRVEEPPGDHLGLAFLPVEAGDTTEIEWAFVEGARPWMLLCLPHDGHPAAGMVHPAVEIVPLDGPAEP